MSDSGSIPLPAAPPGVLCSVCSCPFPAGNHYGAVTCHACKSFFKRTVQFSLSYSCMRRARHCSLRSERNRACGACRFRRCLEAGMRTGLVRSLAPDNSHELGATAAEVPRHQQQRQQQQQQQQRRPRPAHQRAANCPTDTVPDLEQLSIDLSSLPTGLDLTSTMSSAIWLLVESFLGSLVKWAKQLPDFASFALQDQVALLQRHWLDVIVLQTAWNSHPYTGTLTFCAGFTLHESQEAQIHQVPRVSRMTRCLARCLGLLDLRHAELLRLRAIFFLESSCYDDWTDRGCIDRLQRRHLLALIRLCPCPIRRARLLQLGGQVAGGRLLALAYFNRALNLEGQVPPPLTDEILRVSLQAGDNFVLDCELPAKSD